MDATYAVPHARDVHAVDMDPSLANSVGLHHTLASAVADLVDNSLDAGAQEIRVRLLLDRERPIGLQVIDDGRGMDAADLDRALTYSLKRDYGSTDLGHFGVGLKAASLSQADTVVVCSSRYGAARAGRVLTRRGTLVPPTVGRVEDADASKRLVSAGIDDNATGTLVEWLNVRTFTSSADLDEQRRWISTTVHDLQAHLGLVFHRLVDDCTIRIDTVDVTSGMRGPSRTVTAIDPFEHGPIDRPGYPRELDVHLADGSHPLRLVVDIWPPKSQDPGYKIGGKPGKDSQGFFVYRNDRLLQIGGWCDIWGARDSWELARVRIDLLHDAPRHVQINPEKSGVTFSSDLRRAVERAASADGGVTMQSFLADAAGVELAGRRRQKSPIVLARAGEGIPRQVRDAVAEVSQPREGERPVDTSWRILPSDTLFFIDLDRGELVINLRYRAAIAGPGLKTEDAPVVKTLLHLLMEKYFAGSYLGQREKREISAWNTILLAAVRAQEENQ